MKPNVFMTTILRQPIRSLILALLVGGAAFAFTLRAVEYMVVRSEIARLEEHFTATGFLTTTDPDNFANALDFDDPRWIEVISNSPYVDYVDVRRLITGEIEGHRNAEGVFSRILNADMERFAFWRVANHRYIAGRHTYLARDAYFFATLRPGARPAEHHPWLLPWLDGTSYVIAYFDVDEVLGGYPEYVTAGEPLRFLVPMEAFTGMVPGERYLLRGMWDNQRIGFGTPAHDLLAHIDGVPFLNAILAYYTMPFIEDALPGLDLGHALVAAPLFVDHGPYFISDQNPALGVALAQIADYLEVLERNQRAVVLVGTRDMYAMHTHRNHAGQLFGITVARYVGGRLLTYDDYINANPVVVIHPFLADYRGISLGDTLDITFRDGTAHIVTHDDPYWRDQNTYTITVEVVGVFTSEAFVLIPDDVSWLPSMEGTNVWRDDAPGHIYFGQAGRFDTPLNYTLSNFMFIPDSLIPEDFSYYQEIIPTGDNLFTFALRSARYEPAFLEEVQGILLAMGINVHLLTSPLSQHFFESVDTINLSLAINFAVFAASAGVGLMLAVFIYTITMRRNFAIARTLGIKSGFGMWQMVGSAALFWVPSVVLGIAIAWNIAIRMAQNSLAVLHDYVPPHMQVDPLPESIWLVGLMFGIAIIVTLITFLAIFMVARRSILQILQKK